MRRISPAALADIEDNRRKNGRFGERENGQPEVAFAGQNISRPERRRSTSSAHPAPRTVTPSSRDTHPDLPELPAGWTWDIDSSHNSYTGDERQVSIRPPSAPVGNSSSSSRVWTMTARSQRAVARVAKKLAAAAVVDGVVQERPPQKRPWWDKAPPDVSSLPELPEGWKWGIDFSGNSYDGDVYQVSIRRAVTAGEQVSTAWTMAARSPRAVTRVAKKLAAAAVVDGAVQARPPQKRPW